MDVIKGLGLLFSKTQATTPIRCGVVHFTGRGGVLSADRLIVDTGPVLIDGGGVINLDTETLGFTVKGHPKKFQLVRLMAPITISGPILSPKVSVKKGGMIAQGGAALACWARSCPRPRCSCRSWTRVWPRTPTARACSRRARRKGRR